MDSGLASITLANISFRIATEPEFIQNLRVWIANRKLDSGQAISNDDAAALTAFLDQNDPFFRSATGVDALDNLLETWFS